MKTKLFALLAAVMLLLCACGGTDTPENVPASTEPPVKTVGICLPGRGNQWKDKAKVIVDMLEEKGYRVLLEYGSEDTLLQQSQVQTLVNMPVDCLVIAAFDGLTLSSILKDAPMPVLAYDRMVTYTENIAGFVAADHRQAGRQIATQALMRCPLEGRETPVTVEFFMGQPQDPNALWFYEGVMEVLQPYLESGKLECRSGRTRFEDVCLPTGDAEAARDVCFDYLGNEYENSFPDILITGSDELAEGCIQALEGMAFLPEEAWPVVTGLGGTEDGLWRQEEGSLTITAAMDRDALAEECVRWVLALLEGTALPEHETISNGVIDVPTKLQPMQILIK